MKGPIEVRPLTDGDGNLLDEGLLRAAEPVHRQLRDKLPPGTEAYQARLAQVFATGGRLAVALVGEPGTDRVAGLALWRLVENTYEGRRLYVDDLVTDGAVRSQGVGAALLRWLEEQGRSLGCDVLALDSGVQRAQAHRFYFRENFHIASYSFRKNLK